jgi:CBS domain-containing protein
MLSKISVTDYMSKNVITVTPDMEVIQAIKIMLDNKITSVPVLDERGELIGLFSEKDGVKGVVEFSYNQSMDGKVRENMTKETPIIDFEKSVIDAAIQFQEMNTRSLPVFQEGRMVGIISRADVMRALINLS